MASLINFSGLSTGINTSALISAIMQQESQPLTRLQGKQTLNTKRSTLLSTLSVDLLSVSTSLNTLNSSAFQNQLVTSSDSTNAHVTATATGATPGSYDVQVDRIATKAQMTLSSSTLTSSVGQGTYTLTDQDGTTHAFTLDAAHDNLSGLQSAINGSGADVTATIVDSGVTGASRYKLVVTGKNTGTTSSGGATFTLGGPAGAGTVLGAGGSQTSSAAQNAHFWVNGIELYRSSNTVNDAVTGMTFTLKSGGQTGASTPTTLTVATDTDGITKALQDVVAKYNAALKLYKDNSQGATYASNSTVTSGSSSTEAVTPAGALANQPNLRSILSGVRSAIMSVPSGLSGNTYQSAAEVGLKTNQDGTLSLDATALKSALGKDPAAVANLFNQVNTAVQDTVTKVTSQGSGQIALIRQGIDTQNSYLNLQIDQMQNYLTRRKKSLDTQYANLEATVGQLQSAGQSLGSLR